MTLVRNGIGCKELDARVNKVLRELIVKVLMSEAGEKEQNKEMIFIVSEKLMSIANALKDMDEIHKALSLNTKSFFVSNEESSLD